MPPKDKRAGFSIVRTNGGYLPPSGLPTVSLDSHGTKGVTPSVAMEDQDSQSQSQSSGPTVCLEHNDDESKYLSSGITRRFEKTVIQQHADQKAIQRIGHNDYLTECSIAEYLMFFQNLINNEYALMKREELARIEQEKRKQGIEEKNIQAAVNAEYARMRDYIYKTGKGTGYEYDHYALMDLYEGVTMEVGSEKDSSKDNFTIKQNNKELLRGVVEGEGAQRKIVFTCTIVSGDDELSDNALCLMVDFRRRHNHRIYGIDSNLVNSFPIHGSSSHPEKLVRLYQLALIQGMDPVLDQNCLAAIQCSEYANTLAYLMYIKQRVFKIDDSEKDFFDAKAKELQLPAGRKKWFNKQRFLAEELRSISIAKIRERLKNRVEQIDAAVSYTAGPSAVG